MFKHILLATDGSAASEHAAKIAAGMARTHGARVTAIVMGSHGRTGLARLMVGSVVSKVLAAVSVPVLVVR